MTMIPVHAFADDKAIEPNPVPVMINPTLVEMIENADFVPGSKHDNEDPKKMAEAPVDSAASKPVELHQPAAAPIPRTKITMHSGKQIFVGGSMAEAAGLLG